MSMRLVIHGRVQGVGYRVWAEAQAQRLGLDGWVRNRSDGCVEILAHGTSEAQAALERLCQRGPPAALVRQVIRTHDSEAVGRGFSQRPTV